jgi:hypothetical protein
VPTPTFTLDTKQFEQAVKFVFENTRRALPEIINRAALVTIIGGKGVQGAMKKTRRAAAGDIRSVPARAVAMFVRRKNKGQKLTPKQIDALVKKEYKRRLAAIGYTATVGWARAANDLGGSMRMRGGKGYAQMGYAKPASYGHFEAVICNSTPAAELIGAQPLQEALNETAADMIQFWQARTGVIFK